MKVLIEREFLIQYEKDILNPEKLRTNSLRRLMDFFEIFAQLEVYTNIPLNEFCHYNTLKRLLNYCGKINDKDVFISTLSESKIGPSALAFVGLNDYNWKERFINEGGIYFDSNNYLDVINKIISIENIIRINSQNDKFAWDFLSKCTLLPFNSIILIDPYITSNIWKAENNLLPITNIFSKLLSKITFTVISAIGNKKQVEDTKKIQFLLNDKIVKKYNNMDFNLVPFYPPTLDKKRQHFIRIHDRYIISNYFVVSSGKGFDILPFNTSEEMDVKISIKSFLNKEAYDDFKEFIPLYRKYIEWVNIKYNENFKIPFM